jgi:hypothetical protein
MNGCKAKCPYRLWINCPQYINLKAQQYKLKKKKYNKNIEEYYKNVFKINYELSTSIQNG